MISGDGKTVHLCIDMQRLFTEAGPWPAPWMKRVSPNVLRLVQASPELTIFTRFIPPLEPEDAPGQWRIYYERWRDVTRARLDASLLDLIEPLQPYATRGAVVDKSGYCAFSEPGLVAHLKLRGADRLIVSGSETDVCVLSTVLHAVDLGLHVTVIEDAICSSSDEGHDALMSLYRKRFSLQIETATTEDILQRWH